VEIGSVVIMDTNKLPVGIVTVKDILAMYSEKNHLPTISMNSGGLSKGSETLVQLFTRRFNHMIGRRHDIEKAQVKVTESKQGGVYKAVLSIFKHGKHMIISEEGKNLQTLLKDVKHKARRLLSQKQSK
jgi:hypothetical protein